MEGVGEDEEVKSLARRGGGGGRRCYRLLHLNIYDFDLILIGYHHLTENKEFMRTISILHVDALHHMRASKVVQVTFFYFIFLRYVYFPYKISDNQLSVSLIASSFSLPSQ